MASSMSETVKSNMLKTLAAKITSTHPGDKPLESALKVSRALDAAKLSSDNKQVLQEGLEARMSAGFSSTPAGSKPSQDQQEFTAILNSLTQGDWNKVLAPNASPETIMAVASQRISGLGIRSLHEQTVRWIVTIVAHCIRKSTGRFPKYQMMYKWVTDFKRDYAAYKQPYPHVMLTHFPNEPKGLPSEVFQEAYPDLDDPPISHILPGFQALGLHTPLRSNKAHLVREIQME